MSFLSLCTEGLWSEGTGGDIILVNELKTKIIDEDNLKATLVDEDILKAKIEIEEEVHAKVED